MVEIQCVRGVELDGRIVGNASDLGDDGSGLNRAVAVYGLAVSRDIDCEENQVADLQSSWSENVVGLHSAVDDGDRRGGGAGYGEVEVGERKIIVTIYGCEAAVDESRSSGNREPILYAGAEAWLDGIHIVRRAAAIGIVSIGDVAGSGLIAAVPG